MAWAINELANSICGNTTYKHQFRVRHFHVRLPTIADAITPRARALPVLYGPQTTLRFSPAGTSWGGSVPVTFLTDTWSLYDVPFAHSRLDHRGHQVICATSHHSDRPHSENQKLSNWKSETGMETLDQQLNRHSDAAFAGTVHTKLYLIGAIGPHWRYDERVVDGQDLRPLIGWHDITHDQSTFDDLEKLPRLVFEL